MSSAAFTTLELASKARWLVIILDELFHHADIRRLDIALLQGSNPFLSARIPHHRVAAGVGGKEQSVADAIQPARIGKSLSRSRAAKPRFQPGLHSLLRRGCISLMCAAPSLAVSNLADGAGNMNINWNLYNGTTPLITQFSQASATSVENQEGTAAANLTQVSIENGDQVLAQYLNGNQVVVGQIAMASILNPESLISAGDNNFTLSANTALPAVSVPDTAGRGQLLEGDLWRPRTPILLSNSQISSCSSAATRPTPRRSRQ
jgi:hypothetical protein